MLEEQVAWEDMSEEDKADAMALLEQLDNLFEQYKERDACAQISPEKD